MCQQALFSLLFFYLTLPVSPFSPFWDRLSCWGVALQLDVRCQEQIMARQYQRGWHLANHWLHLSYRLFWGKTTTMQESCPCSVCGWGWPLLLWGCIGISTLASCGAFPMGKCVFTAAPWPGRSPVANEFSHNSGQTSLSALLSSAGSLLCCLVFWFFFSPGKARTKVWRCMGKGDELLW